VVHILDASDARILEAARQMIDEARGRIMS
jgi:hypothetical protein